MFLAETPEPDRRPDEILLPVTEEYRYLNPNVPGMISYFAAFVSERTDHPVVFTGFIIGAIFLVAALVVSQVTNNGVASGFLLMYAGGSAMLALLGYVVLFIAKGVSMLRDQTSPTASSE